MNSSNLNEDQLLSMFHITVDTLAGALGLLGGEDSEELAVPEETRTRRLKRQVSVEITQLNL